MSKTLDVLIYKIPLSRMDKNKLRNTKKDLININYKNEFSVGLYFCSMILKRDFEFTVEYYFFSKNGKPFLGTNGPGFSISYTDDYVYIAIIKHGAIGIDAEKVKAIDINVSKEFMTEKEFVSLEKATDKYEYFYKIWTLKESFLKLIGLGINDSINTIEFVEHLSGTYSINTNYSQKVYLRNFSEEGSIISLSSYCEVEIKIIGFIDIKEFLKMYEN